MTIQFCDLFFCWNDAFVTSPDIQFCEIDIGNPKYTTFTKLVQVWNFIITFELKVIRHEKREAQYFYADFSICLPPRAAPSRKLLIWSRRAPKVNLLPPRQELNSLTQPMIGHPVAHKVVWPRPGLNLNSLVRR